MLPTLDLKSSGFDQRIYGADIKSKAKPMTINFDLDLESARLINGFRTLSHRDQHFI